jgi:hypothetical protein
MKKILFIMTHLGSGWEQLVEFLKRDPRFDFFQTGHAYRHPEDLKVLTNHIHRRDNSSAIWSDVILYNENFTCRDFCRHYRFVYWIKPFDGNHPEMKQVVFPQEYYDHRMTGLRGYLRRTPEALVNPSQDDSFLSSILG